MAKALRLSLDERVMLGQVVFADIKRDTSEDIVGNPGHWGYSGSQKSKSI